MFNLGFEHFPICCKIAGSAWWTRQDFSRFGPFIHVWENMGFLERCKAHNYNIV